MEGIHSPHGKLADGLNVSPSLLVDTFIMHCAVMEEKDAWLLTKTKSWLTVSILKHQSSVNSTDASVKLPVTGIIER